MLFLTKYLCMLSVLTAFYVLCQVNYLDYVLSNGAKTVIILAMSWHLGAFLFKHYVTNKLGLVSPENKAVFITGE